MAHAVYRVIAHALPKLQRQHTRLLGISARAQHHELLPAQPAEHIGTPQALADALAQATQHPVTDRMAETVVDAFEVINVEHDHRQRLATSLGTLQLALQPFLEVTAVMDAGQ